jgi:ABC-type transport system substrate-binding protein
MADYLRRAGFDASLNLLTRAQRVASEELQTLYPALSTNNNTLRAEMGMAKLATRSMATPENQWLGSNKTGWSNAEFDDHFAAWGSSLDRAQRDQHMVEMARIVSVELPNLPLYLNFEVVAYVANLAGPRARGPSTDKHENVHAWHWR